MIGRTYRSDTWPHQPAKAKLKESLANGEPSIQGPVETFEILEPKIDCRSKAGGATIFEVSAPPAARAKHRY
ncbi:hypothetical protein, partial [Mesorhizobium sp. M7A.F.Ca.CA.001.08.1.1]|uniref:hypothetical protein n=1 Tax=Mesorhizobium sp. M7A.F.Ca.CA.001.08.1.1 TaxID=2496691 RepID=UPI0019D1CF4E